MRRGEPVLGQDVIKSSRNDNIFEEKSRGELESGSNGVRVKW